MNEIKVLEKFNSDSIISCMYCNGTNKSYFIKRFLVETGTLNKEFSFINKHKGTKLILVSADTGKNLTFKFSYHSNLGVKKEKVIDVIDFVSIKGWKSIGNKVPRYKHMSGFQIIKQNNNIDSQHLNFNNGENDGDTLNLFE